ncbi:hypothetical protein JNUCC1_01460 [Lentibacillus sp. JNUCC-1]|nr:hypothetical protein [Lentibacillus sp. JNUCC-1]MUV37654.1 hypothetical protein [Lentibacillus sp. JNUCC-1]
MEEEVGVCVSCGKTVYCRDGFLDGVVTENHELYCFECVDENT